MAHYKPTIKKSCPGCGNPVEFPPSKGDRLFCSRACMATDMVFMSKVEKTDTCWNWTAFTKDGYGQWRGRGAHIHSYEIHKGAIPAGMLVMHSCDNRRCINPAHLSLGTIADNVADCVSKGRQAKGENKPCAKLTTADAAEIRECYRHGGISSRALGARFGVSKTTIMAIVNGELWREAIA